MTQPSDNSSTEIRTKFIDYDSRPKPKTNQWCVKCQKDLKTGSVFRKVFVTNGMLAVLPDDLTAYKRKNSDYGWQNIGLDCAKILGMEWTVEREPHSPSSTEIRSEAEKLGHVWITAYTASKYAGVLSRGLLFRSIHDSKEEAEKLMRDPQASEGFTITEYAPVVAEIRSEAEKEEK